MEEERTVAELYKFQITSEINNIHARPLSYSGSKLVEILDEFELDYRVTSFSQDM